MSDYPYNRPFVMTETVTGAAVCVVVDAGIVKFHDSEADTFPGPVISDYRCETFLSGERADGAAFALRLGDESTYLAPETYGVIRAFVAEEYGVVSK